MVYNWKEYIKNVSSELDENIQSCITANILLNESG